MLDLAPPVRKPLCWAQGSEAQLGHRYVRGKRAAQTAPKSASPAVSPPQKVANESPFPDVRGSANPDDAEKTIFGISSFSYSKKIMISINYLIYLPLVIAWTIPVLSDPG